MRWKFHQNEWGFLLAGGLVIVLGTPGALAREIDPHTPRDIEVHPSREVETLRSPGVDVVSPQGPLDPRIVGRWAIGVPSTSYQTEIDRGNTIERRNQVNLGGSMGLLAIDVQGNYAWRSQGRPLATGRIQQVQPRRDAEAGKTYWLVSNGDDQFYLTSAPHGLTLYSTRTNMFAANGKAI